MSLKVQWVFEPVAAGGPAYVSFYFDNVITDAAACVADTHTLLGSLASATTVGGTYTFPGTVVAFDAVTGSPIGATAVTAASVAGTNSTGTGFSQGQALVSLRTGVFTAGRQIQGRINLPGLASTNFSVEAGTVLPATITAFNTAFATYLAGTVSVPAVWSRKNGVTQAVSAMTCEPLMSTLRSRSVRG